MPNRTPRIFKLYSGARTIDHVRPPRVLQYGFIVMSWTCIVNSIRSGDQTKIHANCF